MKGLRFLFALSAIALALTLSIDADARMGGGGSFGSRGVRSFSPPAVTRTAPNTAAPLQRTITQPGNSNAIGQGVPGGGFGRGFFGTGLLGGLAAGFLGAGLFGLLFGHGFFGGLGGFASLLGLIIQIGLVVIVARMAWAWWQRRNGLAYAGAPAGAGFQRADFTGTGAAGTTAQAITIGKTDYDAFEQLLTEIQQAFSAEDRNALRARMTPEMFGYLSEELDDNARRGVVNQVSDLKLLQGDLSEAWSEGAAEYATVAMRFALTDRTIDRASGRLVDGSDAPGEATEVWTFTRPRGGAWVLSAIQQT